MFRIVRSKQDMKSLFPKKKVSGSNNKFSIDQSVILSNCSFDIAGDNNEIVIDKNCYFQDVIFYVHGNDNKIEIGDNVGFARGGFICIQDYGCVINIGDHSTFEEAHIAATEPNSRIDIGKDCMFANDIDIRTGDSHSIIDINSHKRINFAKNVTIEDHVWVAAHVSILKGAHISKNSIVATRSVLTRKFTEEHIIVGGSPAVKIRDGITWARERIYD